MRRDAVALKGVTLATYLDGEGEKPWIVLSNSLGATHAMWDQQMPLLARRYRVLRYDTRGHGASSVPAAPYCIEDLAGDVLGLMDHYGVARADFMGLSLGGTTGLGLGLDHPDRIGRIVCCDAPSETTPADIERWDRRIATIRTDGIAPLTDEIMARWCTQAFRDAHPDILANSVAMLLATSEPGYIGCAEALKDIHYFPRLGDLTVPVFYIAGRQDSGFYENTLLMAEKTPGGRLKIVDPGAHLPNVENPEAFNRILADWLDIR